MRPLVPSILVALAGCGGPDLPPAAPSAWETATAELQVARAGCLACHPATGATAVRLGPLPAPVLEDIGARWAGGTLAAFLEGHFRTGGPGEAADLAAYLLREAATPLEPVAVDQGAFRRGDRLWRELACCACHRVEGIEGLAARTDHRRVSAFLREPTAVRPALGGHDFMLSAGEAGALAAFLLREQLVTADAAPPSGGIAWQCFELRIENGDQPDLEGHAPSATGVTTVIDLAQRTRDDHIAMRFCGEVLVPADGDYTFTVGSDDGSWLWIDGELVVDNSGLKPHRRKAGDVRLTAGWHALQVVFTEKDGGESLEVLWQGPGFEREVLPATALRARNDALVPPRTAEAPDAVAVERGRVAFAARRCGACHAGDDAPQPTAAKAWEQLAGGACPLVSEGTAALVSAVRSAATAPRSAAADLAFALQRDGCMSCHSRDGNGGLRPTVRPLLVEVEDLGDEGRLPPDLTDVGSRLRQSWIEGVLSGQHRVRPFMRARMPRLPADLAAEYAARFAAVDAPSAEDDAEPTFSLAAATEGRRIAGNTGSGCITCHDMAGHASLGPRGMDLAVQYQRTRPGWFREWLLRPLVHRPGTRMPTFWPQATPQAIAQVDAVRTWLSLGAAAPLPEGLVRGTADLVLEAADRPRLHGAFLKDLSARCLAMGSPLRTHYAYDLANLRLAWLWRGAFLDAEGTWAGRAGELLVPLGEDWAVLPEGCPFELAASGNDTIPRLLGWRLDAEGYPTFRLGLGAATVEDHPRPRLREGGSEMVRTVRALGGAVRMRLPEPGGAVQALVNGASNHVVTIPDGGTVEVIYRW